MNTTKEIGDFGEKAAAMHLKEKGYIIIEHNFRSRFGEIDIIARDIDGTYVFVEVKTRKNILYGRPSEYVDYRKQNKIRKTAMYYTHSDDVDMRFDIIEIIYSNEKATEINHIENAF